ncbi:hypothetical protein ACJZ2D_004446 [Fusarium nematophilum]
MESRPINDTLWMRFITLLLYNVNRFSWIRNLRKHPARIVLASSKLCIKATAFTTLAEANAMQFVAQHTSIPVPKVYSSFEHKGRASILAQLKATVAELRSIPPLDNCAEVANVDGGPIFDQRLPDKSFWGPFVTIRDFHSELRHGLELQDDEEALPGLRELIAFHNEAWPKPVFTHGDLSSLNIVALGDKVTGILDWESAGWMPPYCEYTSAWHVNPRNVFWREAVNGFLTPLPRELEMEKIRRRYFGDF